MVKAKKGTIVRDPGQEKKVWSHYNSLCGPEGTYYSSIRISVWGEAARSGSVRVHETISKVNTKSLEVLGKGENPGRRDKLRRLDDSILTYKRRGAIGLPTRRMM